MRKNKSKALTALFLSIPLAAIKAYQVSLVKPIFDEGLSHQSSFNQALMLAGILVALALVNYPIRFIHFYWIRFVVDRATCDIRETVYKKIQSLPMSFFTKSKQGVILSNILNDTQVMSQGFRTMIDLVREPLTAIALFGLALYRDWQLTLVIVVVAPLFLIIFQLSGKKIRFNVAKVQEEMGEVSQNVSEGIQGQKISKAFNLQNYSLKRFAHSLQRYFDAQMKTTKIEENAR